MIREREVNAAVIQHAAEELEIGVPIRAWRVEEGQLVLSLAYGGEARWEEKDTTKVVATKAEDAAVRASKPWRFVEALQAAERRPVPTGDLGKLTKRELQLVLQDWGYQTESLRPKKAEYVEAVAWLREILVTNSTN